MQNAIESTRAPLTVHEVHEVHSRSVFGTQGTHIHTRTRHTSQRVSKQQSMDDHNMVFLCAQFHRVQKECSKWHAKCNARRKYIDENQNSPAKARRERDGRRACAAYVHSFSRSLAQRINRRIYANLIQSCNANSR